MAFPYVHMCGNEIVSAHGATLQKYAREILVDVVQDEEPPFGINGGLVAICSVPNAIPVGAFDVVVTGLVTQTIVKTGPQYFSVAAKPSADIGYRTFFGLHIPLAAGTTWGPRSPNYTAEDPTNFDGGYDRLSLLQALSDGYSPFYHFGSYLLLVEGDEAGQVFQSGQVRLAIFYSLVTAPES